MSKKIDFETYEKRFNTAHPGENVKIEGYTAISKPVTIVCLVCGKKHFYKNGNRAITGFRCCGQDNRLKIESVKDWLNKNEEFDFICKIDSEHIIVRHNVCGNQFKKNIQHFFMSPTACGYCDSKSSKLILPIDEARNLINEQFNKQLDLLEYTGRHEKCKYRCLQCGQIFTQKFDCLLGSSGCPKCDKKSSLGERAMAKILDENNIKYQQQVGASGLNNNKQKFDFGIYNEQNELVYFIEIQGEQHYRAVDQWGGKEAFERRLELDENKRRYCQEYGIPLYEIKYFSKKFQNLDILPFWKGSTTIPAKGSTL